MKISSKALPFVALVFCACPGSGPTAPPVIASFSASQSAICDSGTVTLSWTAADAASITIDNGVGNVGSTTSTEVTVSATTTFTLTATNSVGSTTKTVTVDFLGFPHQPAGTANFSYNYPALSADRTRLLLGAFGVPAFVCTGLACNNETLAGDHQSETAAEFVSLGADFDGFENIYTSTTAPATTAVMNFAESDGAFAAGQIINDLQGTDSLAPVAASANVPESRIGLVVEDFTNDSSLVFSELANGTWNSAPLILSNIEIQNATVWGDGYAADGTPFIVYSTTPDTVTVLRRAGPLWAVAASQAVNGGVAIASNNGPSIALSPDGTRIAAMFSSVSGSTLTAKVFDFDLATNTFGAVNTVVSTTFSTATFSTSAAFSSDGATAHWVMNSWDGRAWTGTYAKASRTFSAASPFHPELIVNRAWTFYDACDTARILYLEKAGQADPEVLTIDAL